ncbi:ABC-type spermidine/putrescine transport system, ATPase component [Desulforapulum autotrophicum HRM2]|uniref:ABC-type spermidine/putrescine transport system, ATPase component n=1 Tax=Desulforapulum autotrophicum (strain ATCC 43914 / DSM 3382 / VKM B-1955 / HRM2) TaxID=177437 RepID=C0Q959_DESAH|nr:ABC transporter ATP-binding protein [Desulforapulum autotrophicum]ACN16564.1 ABC-type spermidine/putrescine transport system, ATPase component [Desulforapulum autotrophicum HRM2]
MSKKEKDPAFVKFKGIVKRFGKVTAVQTMDLDIPEGSLVTLLGPSGCGKTTLLRMLAGLESPTEGDIIIKGKRVNDTPIHKRNLGMIFQNYALFPHKTIFDNVAFGLKYRGFPKDEMRTKVIKALEMVRLPGVENRMPSQLSGGQQQRIALARAIVIEPDVLLMDEPLSALDENLREEMRREIDNLQQVLGVTTLFVTHDQREALSMSDKIIVMKDGKKQQEGTPIEVYNNSVNHFVADFLGHSNFLSAVVESNEDEMVKVRLEDKTSFLARSSEPFLAGDKVDIVVRAQKFLLGHRSDYNGEENMNLLFGRISDRSYMGGEVSYYVELPNGQVIHVINLVKRNPFKQGDEVHISVNPENCRLLRARPKA